MQKVVPLRSIALMAATLLVAAASLAVTAEYAASAPGERLQPRAGAAEVVSLLQGQQHILWTSLTGTVTSVAVRGWPVGNGEVELGGAVAITRPDSGEAGIIDFGEQPMSVIFAVGNG